MAPPKQQRLVSLEERTDRHPQLKGRAPCPQIALSQVAAALADGAYYLGAGSFCRVWGVSSWDGGPAAARGQPVAVKVVSASFKHGYAGARERRAKQAYLERMWNREVNAHMLLEGQPRVVQACLQMFGTFQGSLVVPPLEGDTAQEPQLVEVVGMVESLCNQNNLHVFLHNTRLKGLEAALWPLWHLAGEAGALAGQLAALDGLGLSHQDIKLENIMVDTPAPGAFPVLKLGDLNGMQWTQLTVNGSYWIGTVGFLPRRVRRLYLGLQGEGELNYDVYQLGKVFLRLLLQRCGERVAYPKSDGGEEGMEEEDALVRGGALALLAPGRPPPQGQPPMELWAFGVAIGLQMTWDLQYSCAADHHRLAPAAAAEALQEWGRLCKAWAVTDRGGFWASATNRRDMAALYLRLAELARVPPLGRPRDPALHTQADDLIVESLSPACFFSHDRMAPVRQQVEALLAEREAAAAAKAAAKAALAAAPALKPSGGAGRSSFRSTAWEQKLSGRAQAEADWLDGASSSSSADENRAAARRRPKKRRDPAAAAAAGHAKRAKPAAAVAKPAAAVGKAGKAAEPAAAGKAAKPAAAKPAAVAAGGGSQEEAGVVVLGSKLTLKAVWGDARPAADAPQLLGDKKEIAVMLADTVRAAVAARGPGGGGDALRLRLSHAAEVTFTVGGRRSVSFRRADLAALAADAGGCAAWNRLVAALLRAWQEGGREGSQAERLRLLRPLVA